MVPMSGEGQAARRKADSTLRSSQAVPHPSTNRALCRLTLEVERDPVHSTRYGRQRTQEKIKIRLHHIHPLLMEHGTGQRIYHLRIEDGNGDRERLKNLALRPGEPKAEEPG